MTSGGPIQLCFCDPPNCFRCMKLSVPPPPPPLFVQGKTEQALTTLLDGLIRPIPAVPLPVTYFVHRDALPRVALEHVHTFAECHCKRMTEHHNGLLSTLAYYFSLFSLPWKSAPCLQGLRERSGEPKTGTIYPKTVCSPHPLLQPLDI